MSYFKSYRSVICLVAILSASGVFAFSVSNSGTPARADEKTDKAAENSPPAARKASPEKQDEPAPILQKFMRQKLHASTQILEGLCTEDMVMVNDGAETLLKMSREEHWRVSNDIMYRRYSNQFVDAVEEMKREVEDNNIDGTSLAWVNVTMKCLKCHQWVRNTTLADVSEK